MVYPVFLFVCIFLVYLGLYQYDRCVIEQSLCYTLVRGREFAGASGEEREDLMLQMFEERLQEQGLLVTTGRAICEVGIAKQQMTYEGEVSAPLLGIVENSLQQRWQLECSGETGVWEPVAFIRLWDRLRGEE